MRKLKLLFFMIFVLSLALRLIFVVFYDDGKMLKNQFYTPDEVGYSQIAMNFLGGKGLVTDSGNYARRGPIYPLFLAFVFMYLGHSIVAVRIIQAIIGALTCLVIFLIGKEAFDARVGLIAALLSALYWPFLLQPMYLLTEVVFTALLCTTVFLFLRYFNVRKSFILFIAGAMFGITSLCRASILYFFPVLVIWIGIIHNFKFKKALLPIVVTIAGTFIILTPYILRNYRIYKTFVPITIEGGTQLYSMNNPLATGGRGGTFEWGVDQFLPADVKEPFSLESDRRLFGLAIRYMVSHPIRTLQLSARKFSNLWTPFYSTARTLNKIIMSFTYIPVMVLSLCGFILSYRSWQKLSLVYLLIIYYTAVLCLTVAEIRYRYPLMPFFIVFASFCILLLISRINTNKLWSP